MEQWQGQMFPGFPFGAMGGSQGEQGGGGGMPPGAFPGMTGMMDGFGAHDAGGMLGGLPPMLAGGSMPGAGMPGCNMPGSMPSGGLLGGLQGLPGMGGMGGIGGPLAGMGGLGGVGGMNDMSSMNGMNGMGGMGAMGGMGGMGGKGGMPGLPGLGMPGAAPCDASGLMAAHLAGLGGLGCKGALPGMQGMLAGLVPGAAGGTMSTSPGLDGSRASGPGKGPSDDRGKPAANDELSGEVRDFVDKWNLEQRFETRLLEQLRKRGSTWQEDLSALGRTLQEARSPPALLSVKLREMEEGTWEPNRSGGGGGGSAGMCFDFKQGICDRGDRCRFSHGGAGGGAGEGKGGGGPRSSGKGEAAPEWMVGEIRDLCDKFNLDDRLMHRLSDAMRSRERTFKEDMKSLGEVLATARNPPGLLSVKLREMEDGSFTAKGSGRGGGGGSNAPPDGPRGGISAERKRELFGSLSPPPKKRRQRSESRDRRRRGRSRSRKRGSRSRSRRKGKEGREREKEKDHQESKGRRNKDSNQEKAREEEPE